MRTDIYRDPKVCSIAESLLAADGAFAAHVATTRGRELNVTRNALRNATVGALVSLWGVVRHRGRRFGDDLVIKHASLVTCDDICEMPGLGLAMARVHWVLETDEGLVFPNFFKEFNTEPGSDAKAKNAERQRRYREKRNALRDVTVTSESDGREEKSREENKYSVEEEHFVASVFNLWNARAETSNGVLAKARSLTDGRAKKIRTRLRNPAWLPAFKEVLGKLPAPSSPGKDWQPDLAWLIANDEHAFELLEGKLDWRGQHGGPQELPKPKSAQEVSLL